ELDPKLHAEVEAERISVYAAYELIEGRENTARLKRKQMFKQWEKVRDVMSVVEKQNHDDIVKMLAENKGFFGNEGLTDRIGRLVDNLTELHRKFIEEEIDEKGKII